MHRELPTIQLCIEKGKETICAGKFKQQYVASGCQFPNCEIHSENIYNLSILGKFLIKY